MFAAAVKCIPTKSSYQLGKEGEELVGILSQKDRIPSISDAMAKVEMATGTIWGVLAPHFGREYSLSVLRR
ncbi:hypothetical protein GCM10023310_39100 [Paenibacillus vulneris]